MKQRLHPIELTLMIVAALALTSGAVALHTQSQLAEKVVRLHVLANSDSEEDQALKLAVRLREFDQMVKAGGIQNTGFQSSMTISRTYWRRKCEEKKPDT